MERSPAEIIAEIARLAEEGIRVSSRAVDPERRLCPIPAEDCAICGRMRESSSRRSVAHAESR